jgi:hypothetical protein
VTERCLWRAARDGFDYVAAADCTWISEEWQKKDEPGAAPGSS